MSPKKVREVDLDEVISSIAKAVRSREIDKALRLIEANIDALQSSGAEHNRIKLLSYCAWAIDYDASYLDIVEGSLEQFKQMAASELPFCVLAHLTLAEALVKFHSEDYEEAEKGFEQLKADADRIGPELMAVSRYYLSKTARKQARYPEALELVLQAKEIDSAAGFHGIIRGVASFCAKRR